MDPLRPEHPARTALADLAAGLDLAAPLADGNTEVTGVCLDSRQVAPGDLYAALPGANVHGARFAAQAAVAGAAALLTDPAGADLAREAGTTLPSLVVADPRAVLGEVSARVYRTRRPAPTMVGITGTNGKTTTAYLIDSALETLGRSVAMIGTVEIRLGPVRVTSARTTPEAPALHGMVARMAEVGVDTCVMEVSSHALDLHRVDGLVYDLALFTNLSQDHLDHHHDMESYFAAKARLFTPAHARRALICVDDAWGRRLAGAAPIPVRTLASAGPADYRLTADTQDPAAFTLTFAGGPAGSTRLALRSALPGDFNRVNTALAAAALLELGHPVADVVEAVLADPRVPGRMEVVRTLGDPTAAPLAVVDYAHTPDAVAAALAALRSRAPDGLLVVVGAGGDRDRGKRPGMGAAASAGADIVYVTDDNPRSEDPETIRAAVIAGAREVAPGRPIHEISDRRAAIRAAAAEGVRRGPGAVIAVLGKGHESTQEIAGVVHPFDDREELRDALEAALGDRG